MKRVLIVVVSLLILGAGVYAWNFVNNRTTDEMDAMRFKNEYEELNGTTDSYGNLRTEITISEDNNVVYLTYEELIEFIENGTGLLFFGRPQCPWCRLLVPMMLEFADEDDITIYYFNPDADRTANNERYQNILRLLHNYLPVDTVTQDEDDPNFDPNLKRVTLPHLFFMRDGQVASDLFANNHEYLENNERERMKQLIREKYSAIGNPDCTPTTC